MCISLFALRRPAVERSPSHMTNWFAAAAIALTHTHSLHSRFSSFSPPDAALGFVCCDIQSVVTVIASATANLTCSLKVQDFGTDNSLRVDNQLYKRKVNAGHQQQRTE